MIQRGQTDLGFSVIFIQFKYASDFKRTTEKDGNKFFDDLDKSSHLHICKTYNKLAFSQDKLVNLKTGDKFTLKEDKNRCIVEIIDQNIEPEIKSKDGSLASNQDVKIRSFPFSFKIFRVHPHFKVLSSYRYNDKVLVLLSYTFVKKFKDTFIMQVYELDKI